MIVPGPGVVCPECGETVNIDIRVEIVNSEYTYLGEASITTEPDLSDLWAHAWTHSDKGDELQEGNQ